MKEDIDSNNVSNNNNNQASINENVKMLIETIKKNKLFYNLLNFSLFSLNKLISIISPNEKYLASLKIISSDFLLLSLEVVKLNILNEKIVDNTILILYNIIKNCYEFYINKNINLKDNNNNKNDTIDACLEYTLLDKLISNNIYKILLDIIEILIDNKKIIEYKTSIIYIINSFEYMLNNKNSNKVLIEYEHLEIIFNCLILIIQNNLENNNDYNKITIKKTEHINTTITSKCNNTNNYKDYPEISEENTLYINIDSNKNYMSNENAVINNKPNLLINSINILSLEDNIKYRLLYLLKLIIQKLEYNSNNNTKLVNTIISLFRKENNDYILNLCCDLLQLLINNNDFNIIQNNIEEITQISLIKLTNINNANLLLLSNLIDRNTVVTLLSLLAESNNLIKFVNRIFNTYEKDLDKYEDNYTDICVINLKKKLNINNNLISNTDLLNNYKKNICALLSYISNTSSDKCTIGNDYLNIVIEAIYKELNKIVDIKVISNFVNLFISQIQGKINTESINYLDIINISKCFEYLINKCPLVIKDIIIFVDTFIINNKDKLKQYNSINYSCESSKSEKILTNSLNNNTNSINIKIELYYLLIYKFKTSHIYKEAYIKYLMFTRNNILNNTYICNIKIDNKDTNNSNRNISISSNSSSNISSKSNTTENNNNSNINLSNNCDEKLNNAKNIKTIQLCENPIYYKKYSNELNDIASIIGNFSKLEELFNFLLEIKDINVDEKDYDTNSNITNKYIDNTLNNNNTKYSNKYTSRDSYNVTISKKSSSSNYLDSNLNLLQLSQINYSNDNSNKNINYKTINNSLRKDSLTNYINEIKKIIDDYLNNYEYNQSNNNLNNNYNTNEQNNFILLYEENILIKIYSIIYELLLNNKFHSNTYHEYTIMLNKLIDLKNDSYVIDLFILICFTLMNKSIGDNSNKFHHFTNYINTLSYNYSPLLYLIVHIVHIFKISDNLLHIFINDKINIKNLAYSLATNLVFLDNIINNADNICRISINSCNFNKCNYLDLIKFTFEIFNYFELNENGLIFFTENIFFEIISNLSAIEDNSIINTAYSFIKKLKDNNNKLYNFLEDEDNLKLYCDILSLFYIKNYNNYYLYNELFLICYSIISKKNIFVDFDNSNFNGSFIPHLLNELNYISDKIFILFENKKDLLNFFDGSNNSNNINIYKVFVNLFDILYEICLNYELVAELKITLDNNSLLNILNVFNIVLQNVLAFVPNDKGSNIESIESIDISNILIITLNKINNIISILLKFIKLYDVVYVNNTNWFDDYNLKQENGANKNIVQDNSIQSKVIIDNQNEITAYESSDINDIIISEKNSANSLFKIIKVFYEIVNKLSEYCCLTDITINENFNQKLNNTENNSEKTEDQNKVDKTYNSDLNKSNILFCKKDKKLYNNNNIYTTLYKNSNMISKFFKSLFVLFDNSYSTKFTSMLVLLLDIFDYNKLSNLEDKIKNSFLMYSMFDNELTNLKEMFKEFDLIKLMPLKEREIFLRNKQNIENNSIITKNIKRLTMYLNEKDFTVKLVLEKINNKLNIAFEDSQYYSSYCNNRKNNQNYEAFRLQTKEYSKLLKFLYKSFSMEEKIIVEKLDFKKVLYVCINACIVLSNGDINYYENTIINKHNYNNNSSNINYKDRGSLCMSFDKKNYLYCYKIRH